MRSSGHLRLISGTKDDPRFEGPITRLGLWYRYESQPSWVMAMLIMSKVILLCGLAYFLFF